MLRACYVAARSWEPWCSEMFTTALFGFSYMAAGSCKHFARGACHVHECCEGRLRDCFRVHCAVVFPDSACCNRRYNRGREEACFFSEAWQRKSPIHSPARAGAHRTRRHARRGIEEGRGEGEGSTFTEEEEEREEEEEEGALPSRSFARGCPAWPPGPGDAGAAPTARPEREVRERPLTPLRSWGRRRRPSEVARGAGRAHLQSGSRVRSDSR